MTATQVFLRFLRETCTVQEYLFFGRTISQNHGNRYFKNRPLFKRDFVEGYLSRNNRHLRGFMTRLFILAPNLKNTAHLNPRWKEIVEREKRYRGYRFNAVRCKGAYVNYYRHRWHWFLENRLEKGDKPICSPFKKGETYSFQLKNNTRRLVK